jgi:amino acid transporter
MLFSFNYSCVAVVSSISVVFGFGLATGGPVVMTWSWLVGGFFTLMVGLSMAEICSTYPSAGSVYYWAGALAPEGWGPIYSFITGWFNLVGNAAACSGFAFGLASLLSVSISIISDNEVSV